MMMLNLTFLPAVSSPLIGLCVLGKVIGVLLMEALALKPKPDPICRPRDKQLCKSVFSLVDDNIPQEPLFNIANMCRYPEYLPTH